MKKILKMSEEKLHLRHVMLYEFRKNVTVGTTVEKHSRCRIDDPSTPAIRTVKKWFAKLKI